MLNFCHLPFGNCIHAFNYICVLSSDRYVSDNIIAIRNHKFTYYKAQTNQHNIRKLVTNNDGSLSQSPM